MNFDVIDTMVRTAMDAIRNAYAEHGGIAAGACVLSSDGTLYSGCSIDNAVPELALSAEVVAMTRAIADGKREFDAVAIIADIEGSYIPDEASCQFLAEFNVPEVVMADLDGNVNVVKLEELIPYKLRRRPHSDENTYE